MCEELDPPRAHLGRTQLVRAIETVMLAGKRISDLHAEQSGGTAVASGFETARYLLIDPGASLQSRIESRVDEMIRAGWADEVRGLIESVPSDAPAWKASGYRVMRDYIEAKLDLSSARDRIIIETRQYAKRQRTWFRHQLSENAVTRLNPDDPRAGAIAREWWESAE
jgi:tRNA dimethylallyltransferase